MDVIAIPTGIDHQLASGEVLWRTIPKYLMTPPLKFVIKSGSYNENELPKDIIDKKSVSGLYVYIKIPSQTQVVIFSEKDYKGKQETFVNTHIDKSNDVDIKFGIKSMIVWNTRKVKT